MTRRADSLELSPTWPHTRAIRVICAVGASIIGAATALIMCLSAPTPVAAHGGGLDANGCHNDRKNGGYHCHRAPTVAPPSQSAPSTQPTQPLTLANPLARPANLPQDTALTANEQVTGTFDSLNAETRVVTLRDAIGAKFEVVLRDDTTILTGLGPQRLDDYLEVNQRSLPWVAGQRLTVTWRPSADRTRRVAVAVR